MTTLIVGEISFLGASIALALRYLGEDVVLYGPARSDSLPPGIPAVIGEVPSHSNLGSVVYKHRPERLVYVPTKARDSKGAYIEEEDFKQLTASASSLVSLLSTFNIPAVSMVSSYDVFGRGRAKAMASSTVPLPTTLRGHALRLLEGTVAHLSQSSNVLRIGEVFGQTKQLGLSPVNTIIEALVHTGRVGILDADRTLDVYPVDLIAAVIAEEVLAGSSGISHLSSASPVSLLSLGKRVAKVCGLPASAVLQSKRGVLPNARLAGDIVLGHSLELITSIISMVESLRSE